MKSSTKLYCSNLVKQLIPHAEKYEKTVISIATKFREDLEKIEKQAEETYAPMTKPTGTGITSYLDSQARNKAEEDHKAEAKLIAEQRKGFIDARKEGLFPAARAAIRSAQAEFQKEAGEVAESLRKRLEENIRTPLSSDFLNFAKTFNDFGLQLTDVDCKALLEFSEGNPTAYRIIENIISKTNSPYVFTGKGTDSYSEDIQVIEDLASDNSFCCPTEVFHEMNELFNGTPVYQNEAGQNESGINSTFNPTMMSILSGSFDASVEKLSEIAESWTSEAHIDYDPGKAMANRRSLSGENNPALQRAMSEYMK